MNSWEKILLEWCNCLEIAKKVEDINELRDGDFFTNILRIIKKTELIKNEEDAIQSLVYILNDIYPKIQFECTRCSFLELTDKELKILTSLLLHYTCIYDQRDVLTSPLCNKLTKNTQLCIKNFLQLVGKEVTYTDLEKMLNTFGEKGNDQSGQLLADNRGISSPLNGIFNTPASKTSKFHEKDREITKLKNTLEMERYEKSDLQEELKIQSEKTKKLEILLNKSHADIARLKSEITTLECRTPPHFLNTGSTDIEKRLRKEIQSLEHYIEKTEKEQDCIREESCQNRKKLTEWEFEFAQLQTKYFESEKQVEDLTKLSVKQADKITSLEKYCEELNGILEEIQTKPSNESSYFETSTVNVRQSLTLTEENLACSVVEVQLKDAHKQNEEMVSKITALNKELDMNKKLLDSKVKEYEIRYSKLCNETRKFFEMKMSIKNIKDYYKSEIKEYHNDLNMMQQAFNDAAKTYQNSIEKLNSEIIMRKESAEVLSSQVEKTTLELNQCKKELDKVLGEKHKYIKDIEQLEKDRIYLEEQKQEISSKLIISEEKNKNYEERFDKYKYELDQLENEKTKFISDIGNLKHNCETLAIKNNDISSKLLISEKENRTYMDEVKLLEKNIEKCQKELDEVFSERNKCIKDYETLTIDYKDLNSKLSSSEKSNQEYSTQIQELKENIEQQQKLLDITVFQRNECISEIETLKCDCQQFTTKIEELSLNLTTYENKNKEYLKKIHTLEKDIEQRNIKLVEVDSEKNKCVSEIETLKNVCQQLNTRIEELSSQLEMSENNNIEYCRMANSLENEIAQKITELEQCVLEREKCCTQIESLQQNCQSLTSHTEDLSSKLKISEDSIEEYSKKVQSLEEQIGVQKVELDQAISEKYQYSSEIESLKRCCQQLSSQNEDLSSKLEISKNTNEEYFKEKQSLVEEITVRKTELDQINVEKAKLSSEVVSLKNFCQQLSSQTEDLSSKLATSNGTNEQYFKEKQLLEEEFAVTKIELQQIKVEKVKFSSEIESLKHCCQQLSSQTEELSSKLAISQDIVKEYSKKIQYLEEQIVIQKSEEDQYCSEIESLKNKCKQLSFQAEDISSKLEISENTNEEYFMKKQFLEEEIAVTKSELDKVISEKNECSSEMESLKLNCEQLSFHTEELSSKLEINVREYTTKMQSLEEELALTKTELDRVLSEKNECFAEIESLKLNSQRLHAQVSDLSAKLVISEDLTGEYSNKILSLEEEISRKSCELNQVMAEKDKYFSEIESINNDCQYLTTQTEDLSSKLVVSEDMIKKYANEVKSLEQYIDQNKVELDRIITEMECLKFDYGKAKSELLKEKEARQELSTKLSESISETDKYKTTFNAFVSEKENLVSKLTIKEENINELSNKIESLGKTIEKLTLQKNSNEQKIEDMMEKIVAQENLISEYKTRIETENDILLQKDKHIQEINRKYKQLKDEELKKINTMDHFIRILKLGIPEVEAFYKKEMNECNNLILQLKKILILYSNKLNDQEQYLKELNNKVRNEENSNVELSNELKILKTELDKHIHELIEAHKQNDNLAIENRSLKEDYISLIKTISMYNEELNKVVKNLKGKKEKSDSTLSDLQNAYYQFNKLSELRSPAKKTSAESLDEINNLGEQISKINAYIHIYNEKETFYLREIEDLKKELSASSNSYFDLTQNVKEQNCDNEYQIATLTENLHSVIEKYNQLQVEHRAHLNDISEYEAQIIKSRKTHSDELVIKERQITYLKEEISTLEKEISALKGVCDRLSEEHQNEIKMLQEQSLKKDEEIHSLKEKIEKITIEYNNKVQSLEEKIANYEKAKCGSEKNLAETTAEYSLQIENVKAELARKEAEVRSLNQADESYRSNIMALDVQISMLKEQLSQLKKKTGRTEEEYESVLANLQVQVVKAKLELTEFKNKNAELMTDKESLLRQIASLEDEKNREATEKENLRIRLNEERKISEELRKERTEKEALLKELESHKELEEKFQKLKEENENCKFLEENQVELQQKIETLMKRNESQIKNFGVFKIYFKDFKESLNKLLSQKNILETLTNNLRVLISTLNKNIPSETCNTKKFFEKKESLEIISEDIMKQYNRYSKQINDIVYDIVKCYEKNCDNILSTLDITIENYLEKYNLEELNDQVSDLTERSADALEQVKQLQKDFENLNKVGEDVKVQKENILGASRRINVDKMKEDDLRKKNLALRQKVTLIDNAKNNLERTVKKLREENKKLKECGDSKSVHPDNDVHYNMLLQEYIAYKENQERILIDYRTKLDSLQKEYEEHKENCTRTSTPLGDEHFLPSETETRLEADLMKIREAYSNIRIINSKLEAENMNSKKQMEVQKQEIAKFSLIKEAYDKLLEENNKLMTDVDTMKYKRSRDRDEFLRLLKKERSENESKSAKQIQEIKTDYEAKLERMKDKMIKLYREEVNKEMSRVKAGQHESSPLLKIIEKLKGDLFETEQKVQFLEMEREFIKRNQSNLHSSRNSLQLHDSETRSLRDFPASSSISSTSTCSKSRTNSGKLMEFKHPNKVNPSSLDTRRQYEERRVSTLPRTGTVIEEISISRRTSFGVPNNIGQNLQMEDEEEMFNNKYLADLKQGKCDLPPSEDRESRVSELAWRNSLVPPHLKSSYPAEMQFVSPGLFKDDDLKGGNIAFDDSSCKLLPGDKPRKKDFGTTSYKKPGPPTPSKNGGRLSLQGNEIHPVREAPTEAKRNTPSRIRALFTGRNSSKSSSETSPPKRRLNIFRR